MTITHTKPELLVPVGNLEKLEIAVQYGADAVYLAGKDFSLRSFSGNFTDQELEQALTFAHKAAVKVYLACNVYSRNSEQKSVTLFLEKIGNLNPDAIIIADPGLIMLARTIIPKIPIHLSTQANTTNYNTVKFWEQLGIKRVNLARELSLKEIREIRNHCSMEIETFIHGAMCISYSGRCLLSSFLSQRDSNRGLCTHPCRWNYSVVEEQRPGEYHSLMEDSRGSYIFNSKDLCMLDHIPELMNAGINSLKIEGRMKGISYLASVVKTYRQAIDSYAKDPDNFTIDPKWRNELSRIYNRGYSTGFYFNDPDQILPNYQNIRQGMVHGFIGKIIETKKNRMVTVAIKNKISRGDTIEILTPQGPDPRTKVINIFDKNQIPIEHAQPNTLSTLELQIDNPPKGIIRKTL